MSYQVFARKWRPHNFSEVVGQEHVVQALTNALEHDRLHHAYLFTGTRGVGKTTLARILAKALNCDALNGFNPCGGCPACVAINEGRFIDLIEVDAASRTKVEDTRDLLENVQYAPSQGRYKIYLIDEVHMLSTHSFNALLKTLEEPPPHVKFLLATTDPQKIPVTVLSRCLQFNLKRLLPDQIRGQMVKILDDESIEIDESALAQLARAADGSMRDGLSLLDQAIVYGDGKVSEAVVSAMLGHVAKVPVVELIRAVASGDGKTILDIAGQLEAFAADFGDVLQQLLSMLHRVALLQAVPDLCSGDEIGTASELVEALSPEDVQLFYQIALIGQKDLPLAPDPRSGFEMVMLRMLAFRPVEMMESDSRKRSVSSRKTVETKEKPARAIEETVVSIAAPVVPVLKNSSDWSSIVKSLKIAGLTRELANNCRLKSLDEKKCVLLLDPGKETIRGSKAEGQLEKALQAWTGKNLKLQIQIETGEDETPAESIKRHHEEKQKVAEASIRQDKNVRMMTELFDAKEIPGSIKPLN